MYDIIGLLMKETSERLFNNLTFFQPSSPNSWPHENNLGMALTSLSEKYGFRAYSECAIDGGRRDMIIINEESKWVCQIELKHLYDKIVMNQALNDDLYRIYQLKNFQSFFAKTNQKEKYLEAGYNLFGLFLGFGNSRIHTLWNIVDSDMEIIQYLTECGYSSEEIKDELQIYKNWFQQVEYNEKPRFGIIYNNLGNEAVFKNMWMCYFLVRCGELP